MINVLQRPRKNSPRPCGDAPRKLWKRDPTCTSQIYVPRVKHIINKKLFRRYLQLAADTQHHKANKHPACQACEIMHKRRPRNGHKCGVTLLDLPSTRQLLQHIPTYRALIWNRNFRSHACSPCAFRNGKNSTANVEVMTINTTIPQQIGTDSLMLIPLECCGRARFCITRSRGITSNLHRTSSVLSLELAPTHGMLPMGINIGRRRRP